MLTVISVGRTRLAPVTVTAIAEGESEPRRYGITEREYLALGSPAVGDALDEEQGDRLAALDEGHRARAAAGRILAAGDNNAATLLRKLRMRGISPRVAERTVSEMIARGYIREEAQIERLITAAVSHKLYGKRRTVESLVAKGYRREEVEAALLRLASVGDIDLAAARRRLLARLPADATPTEKRALLYRYGHLPSEE